MQGGQLADDELDDRGWTSLGELSRKEAAGVLEDPPRRVGDSELREGMNREGEYRIMIPDNSYGSRIRVEHLYR